MLNHVSPEQKKVLRAMKHLPNAVKAEVYLGNLAGPPMAMQFNRDIKLYGMWEALLYVQGYEEQNMYKKGTADRACTLALESLSAPSDEAEEGKS